MPYLRVFLTTYRRPQLLRRSLQSLLAQTFRDWECEVRNDAPDDDEPAAVVRAAADPRVHYVRHEKNLGGVRLFNQVFSDHRAPYVSLLEDDNWWQPTFLERMVTVMDANPDITLAWSNQRIWQEAAGGNWSDTGRLVRPAMKNPALTRFHWPHPVQCLGALHANGAMLLRTRPGVTYPTPRMEFGGTEAVRERSFPHPLLYVPEPLAVFSFTQTSHRSNQMVAWSTNQVLLAATFMKHAKLAPEAWASLWARARTASPRMTGVFLLACRQDPALRIHQHRATSADWRHFAVRSLRRPLACVQLLRARQRAPEIWRFLDENTAARAHEAPSLPLAAPLPW